MAIWRLVSGPARTLGLVMQAAARQDTCCRRIERIAENLQALMRLRPPSDWIWLTGGRRMATATWRVSRESRSSQRLKMQPELRLMPRFNRSRKRSWCRKQNPSLQGNDGSRKLCAKPQVHYISEEVGYEQIRGHVRQRIGLRHRSRRQVLINGLSQMGRLKSNRQSLH